MLKVGEDNTMDMSKYTRKELEDILNGYKKVLPDGSLVDTAKGLKIPEKPAPAEPIYADKEIKDLVPNIKAGVFADPDKLVQFLSKLTGEKVFLRNGQPVYRKGATEGLTGEGQLYSVLPQTGTASYARAAPDLIADIPAIATGTATAPLMMSPATAPISMGATGMAGAGADVLRQQLENYLLQPKGKGIAPAGSIDKSRMYTTAALDAGAQLIPGAFNLLRSLTKNIDVNKLDPVAMQRRMDLSKKYDIPLAVGEKTALRSAKNLQNALGRYSESADTMGTFYRMREDKTEDAIGNLINNLFGQRSRTDAGDIGQDVVSVGESALQKAKDARKQATEGLYSKAAKTADPVRVAPTVRLIDSMMNEFAQTAPERDILRKIKGMLKKTVITKDQDGNRIEEVVPETDFTRIKNARDTFAKYFETGMGATLKTPMDARITAIRESLNDALKRSSGDGSFELAQKTFAEFSEPIEGLIKLQRKYKNLQSPEQIVKKIALSEPSVIKDIANMINAENPQLYKEVKKSVMQGFFEQAFTRSVKDADNAVDRGGIFSFATLKNKTNRPKLKALLTEDEFKAFDELTDLLAIAGSVNKTGAQTAFMIDEGERIKYGPMERALRQIRFDAPLQVIGRIADSILMGDHADKLAKAVVDPESHKMLREIVAISDNEPRVVALISQLLNKILQNDFQEKSFLEASQ